MATTVVSKDKVVILFAGDSGDGIQLTGSQFTSNAALYGNDVSTFPNFPAEIRAPQGTLPGVSGFQLHFGSSEIFTPGDLCDVLVVMNAAALKANIKQLKKGGIVVANTDGFDPKNLKLAKFNEGKNPLIDGTLSEYTLHTIDITKITRTCLASSGLGTKEMDRSRNMFVLGFVYWMYTRSLDSSIEFIKEQFKNKPALLNANIAVLKAGYNYGETTETGLSKTEVAPAKLAKGIYRSITGNQAVALGLIAAAVKAKLQLFYGTYPITPASDILHELSKHKNFGVKTFQAEDEIAAVCAAIGASFGGNLGVTASSGPGIALKAEAIGLAVMLELPLVICNIQRSGPSTGMPTKTEQADLLQVMYGRNGESPTVVVAAHNPSSCFDIIFQACKIAIEFMTPVYFLSDGYIANGAEPWRFAQEKDLPEIKTSFAEKTQEKFLPYKRDANLVRKWAIPGIKGLEHRIGGLEKENETGNISYDPENHELMVKIRAERIEKIADALPPQKIDTGKEKGKILVIGWGSTYGAIKTAVKESITQGIEVSHAHVNYINPFPKNFEQLLSRFEKILVPEINNGQLVKIIREKFLVNAIAYNKIKGIPFSVGEIKSKILELANT